VATGRFIYLGYQSNLDLTYNSTLDWKYVDTGDKRTQWTIDKHHNQFILRRVYRDRKHYVTAYLEEKSIIIDAFWQVDCIEGTEIETDVKTSDGDSLRLICIQSDTENQTFLRLSAAYTPNDSKNLVSNLDKDFGGFKVNETFGGSNWDFSKAIRFNSLKSATSIQERLDREELEKQRKIAAEEEAERKRIAAKKAAEERRIAAEEEAERKRIAAEIKTAERLRAIDALNTGGLKAAVKKCNFPNKKSLIVINASKRLLKAADFELYTEKCMDNPCEYFCEIFAYTN